MLKIRSVKVHDDTHMVLKQMKAQKRSKSVDEVVRGLIKEATGRSVEQHLTVSKNTKLTAYLRE